jgi:hypothetical protein
MDVDVPCDSPHDSHGREKNHSDLPQQLRLMIPPAPVIVANCAGRQRRRFLSAVL